MLETDTLVTIFKNDSLLVNILRKYYVIKNLSDYDKSLHAQVAAANEAVYYNLSELLLQNSSYILNSEINDLILEDFLVYELKTIFDLVTINNDLLHQVFYSYKYSNVKSFFYENYERFIPEIDLLKIQSEEKTKILQESLMKELDKFSSIVEEISNLQDIDKIPNEYIEYLSQLLGYEREEISLVTDVKYRILIKNIVQLYKIKGTNYSLELFFNFLGYNLQIYEYWFDRRYANYIYTQNPFTGETDRTAFGFYMTPFNPAETLPANVYPKEYVAQKDVSKQLNVFNFNILADKYDPNIILGYKKNYGSEKYSGDSYKYFKTNVVEFKISVLPNSNISTGSKELESLKLYIEFLTPINITKLLTFTSLSPEESISSLLVKEVINKVNIIMYGDNIGDPKKLYENSLGGNVIYQYSTDFDVNNPESATWTTNFAVSPVYLRISLDNGSTWSKPTYFITDTVVENTLLFDTIAQARGTIKEKFFNAFFIFAREPDNELSNLASYYSLNISNGRLHTDSSTRRVINDSQQQQLNVEKIIWQNSPELGSYSEVWMLKPTPTFNPFRGSYNNKIELQKLADNTQNGIYTVINSRTVSESGKTYFVVVLEKIKFKRAFETSGNQLFGGTVSFITSSGYPIYSITKINERGNSVIKIINPYPRRIPNLIPETISSKTIKTSKVYFRYTENKNLCNNEYKIKRFYFSKTTSPRIEYLHIEVELISELVSDVKQSGLTPRGILFIDKDRWLIGKRRHNLLDDEEFYWSRITVES